MRILIANNLYGRRARGGAERVVEVEADGLAERGHEVAVVSVVPGQDLPPKNVCVSGLPPSLCDMRVGSEQAGRVRNYFYRPPNIFDFTNLHRHGWLKRLLWHFADISGRRSAAMFMRIVGALKPDAVHTHNLMGLGFGIPSALKRAKVRHVHTVHDVQLLYPSGLLPAGWDGPRSPHERAYVALMRWRMGSPDVVIFPSEFMRALHDRLGFFPHSRKAMLRNPMPPTSDAKAPSGRAPTFLFVGQMERHKGVLDLLDAWRRWEDRGEARLVMVGDGALAEEVVAEAKTLTGVEFRGRLPIEETRKEIVVTDWLVVPSRVIENAPTIIMEALAAGVPVIAARAGGIPELVEDGVTGLLFVAGDTDALTATLRRAASSIELRGKLAQNIISRRSDFTRVDYVREIERLLEK